jgi:hypothetical protein
MYAQDSSPVECPTGVTTINETASTHVAQATDRLPFNNTLLPKSIQKDLGTVAANP